MDNNGKVDVSEITQKTHYYPFGMEMEAPLTPQSAGYKHLYNGKEAVKDLDLGWYDYGARWYDASIARWSAIDPMGEMMASWSSYSYAFNNPVRFTDPTGMVPEDETTPPSAGTSTDATDNTTGEVVVTATGQGGVASKPIQPLDAGGGKATRKTTSNPNSSENADNSSGTSMSNFDFSTTGGRQSNSWPPKIRVRAKSTFSEIENESNGYLLGYTAKDDVKNGI